MGIIVLGLAIMPFLGVGGMQLYKAEVPGPTPDKLKPRLKDTAMILWKVYVGFSIVETNLLMAGGMEVGPVDNYSGMHTLSKWVLSLDMLLGQLEIYIVIILFIPRFYRK